MSRFDDYWAKSSAFGQSVGESLLDHTEQVIQGLIGLRHRNVSISTTAKEPRFWHQMVLAAGMHDLGKLAPGFQQTVRGGGRFDQRHEILSLAWLDWLLGDVSDNEHRNIAAAIAAHHRDFETLNVKYNLGTVFEPTRNIEDLIIHLPDHVLRDGAALFVEAIVPILSASGLLSADWCYPTNPPDSGPNQTQAIASIKRALNAWSCWIEEMEASSGVSKTLGCFVRGSILIADHAGSAHVSLTMPIDLHDAMATRIRVAPPNEKDFFPHQLESAGAIGNVILTAPTGSGKTESALLWASNNFSIELSKAPLFYVLPFKASMNAMQVRLVQNFANNRSVPTQFERDRVALQHSSAVGVLYSQLMERDGNANRAAFAARRQASLGRLHAAPIRVLSPYQLLRAAYQLKGHEAIWTDAAGGLFVFDEIHAYEPARTAMILGMLEFVIQKLGGKAFVMTATLPRPIRENLLQILGNPKQVSAATETYALFRRHRLKLCNTSLLDPTTIAQIQHRVSNGESVLCVATTVKRAQELQSRLKDLFGDRVIVDLLHSRFALRDRAKKEAAIRKLVATSLGGKRERQVVLVATQVVEVSLDVDFDCLFSDPAPIECLLQRFGRINRSRRPEPKDVIVCTPIDDALPVYDEHLVRRGLASLEPGDGQVIDEQIIQQWLEQVYSGEIGDSLSKQIQAKRSEFAQQLQRLMPFQTSDDLEELFQKLFDGCEVLPKRFVDEYRKILEEAPIEAASLLVPISNGQLWNLRRKKQVLTRETAKSMGLGEYPPIVVDTPYDCDSGLQLNLERDEEST
ncbi:MAG TPA: CRISPR-associated helicase Cas3' [Pirellula sp.]|nr:CRISPR-associated helicase Cas3' [Pirellula sp.]